MQPFTINETAQSRARQRASQFNGTVFGRVLLGAGTAIAATLLATINANWSTGVRVVAAVAGAAAALSVLLAIVYAVHLTRAPVLQRDEARTRLRDLQAWARSFAIEAVSAELVPALDVTNVVLRVKNAGRTASYTIVSTDVVGAVEGEAFRNAFEYTPWYGEVVVEEIPRDEERVVLVAAIVPSGDSMIPPTLSVMTRDGLSGERFRLAFNRQHELWLRVSLRGVDGISYSQAIGMRLFPNQAMRLDVALLAASESPHPGGVEAAPTGVSLWNFSA